LGRQERLYLGNLDSLRDWGHAMDYVEMQWLMLQHSEPKDFVIATGRQQSVRDFINLCSSFLGFKIKWKGSGVSEVGCVDVYDHAIFHEKCPMLEDGKEIIKVDKRYFRPTEVETLLGDSTLAKNELGWNPRIELKELAEEMMSSDYLTIKRELLSQDELS